jgi:hypothetical protein
MEPVIRTGLARARGEAGRPTRRTEAGDRHGPAGREKMKRHRIPPKRHRIPPIKEENLVTLVYPGSEPSVEFRMPRHLRVEEFRCVVSISQRIKKLLGSSDFEE